MTGNQQTTATRDRCPNHTEHAVSDRGRVGRRFPDNNRWPEGLWEPCDWAMGEYVYCTSHVGPHTTGWCSVSNSRKTPLRATTREDAYHEVRAMGFPIYGESAPEDNGSEDGGR